MPSGEAHSDDLDGLIDTGAYVTIIPESIVNLWDVKRWGTLPVRGIGSKPCTIPAVYDVRVNLPKIGTVLLPKVGVADRDNILLGRDALKGMLLAIDGKKSKWAMRKTPSWEAFYFWCWRFFPS